jgi:hypothetical protein
LEEEDIVARREKKQLLLEDISLGENIFHR